MIAFEETMIPLTRQQQNLSALRHPQVGDRWAERGYMPCGVVVLVFFGRYVWVDLQSRVNEQRFWNLDEYAAYYGYRSNSESTWADVERLAQAPNEKPTFEQLAYFFYQRFKSKWKKFKTQLAKRPRVFKVFGWSLTLERVKR